MQCLPSNVFWKPSGFMVSFVRPGLQEWLQLQYLAESICSADKLYFVSEGYNNSIDKSPMIRLRSARGRKQSIISGQHQLCIIGIPKKTAPVLVSSKP